MNKTNIPQSTARVQRKAASVRGRAETASERVARLCRAEGGPFVGWLVDEATQRGQSISEMARELGVTAGFMRQLQLGMRRAKDIGGDFARAAATYLGVQPVAVFIVSGSIQLADFSVASGSDEALVDRAFRAVQEEPQVREFMPTGLEELPLDIKRLLVMMYADDTQDILPFRELPTSVRYLQRSAEIHETNMKESAK